MANRATARQHARPEEQAAVPADRIVPLRDEERGALTPLEEQVVTLALRDGLGSLEAPNWIERLVARLFGLASHGRALADPRLEALRRAVVVTRHRHHLPDRLAAELRGAGFTPAQIRAIERRILSA